MVVEVVERADSMVAQRETPSAARWDSTKDKTRGAGTVAKMGGCKAGHLDQQ